MHIKKNSDDFCEIMCQVGSWSPGYSVLLIKEIYILHGKGDNKKSKANSNQTSDFLKGLLLQ